MSRYGTDVPFRALPLARRGKICYNREAAAESAEITISERTLQMQTKRMLSLFLAVITLTGALASCSGGEGENAGAAPETEIAAEAEPEKQPEAEDAEKK